MNITIEQLYQIYREHPLISTDTRKIETGSLFFALKGANFNGNKFALQALEKGAAYAIIDEEEFATNERCLLVDNVLTCLQELSAFHRQQFDIPIIAVTGSNGKTTTKELLNQVLSKKFKTHATEGNFNNHIGVPLTLLKMPEDTEIALIEMGDNHMGEVAALCQIAHPTHGFITNIGKDHLEGFGNFENNIRAKSEIFDYLIKHDGIAFINSKDPILKNMAKRFKNPIWYGGEYDFAFLELEGAHPYISYKDRQEELIQTQLIGAYNFENILLTFCIGKYFEVTNQDIHEAIRSYTPSNNRSQLIEKGSNIIILDAYNANPSSVEAALESFDSFETKKEKVVIIGDMLELGNISEEEHQKMIELASSKSFERRIFVGPLFHQSIELEGIEKYADKELLVKNLTENPLSNSAILIKGSRGIKLETLLDVL
ncbi:UDP-N-acetylmuramoyl-tripeptide--D-alanyl-D-alanine ligase [Algivirga pacifica]|uniref:UDP-N-acetylmuramoyl-tripeptide--D-alanyl-D-alanine ligase n=1 Tax=Algivirga pacifica TaxID=1162670 RepID=A0ABP9D2J1_9BACT